MAFPHRLLPALVLGLVAGLAAGPGRAASVDGLYEGVVPGDVGDAGRSQVAAEALRQVVVRVTGRRAAASDPALAPLYADARRSVQTFRALPGGQVAIGFDGAALEASLRAAGQRLWSRERPVTLVLLMAAAPGGLRAFLPLAADSEPQHELARAARERGLPLAWPVGLDPTTERLRVEDALAGRLEPLGELARQYGADGVLVGRVAAAGVAWSWLGPAGAGTLSGTATDAIGELADRYGSQFAVASADAGRLAVVVHGVRDLAGYAAALAALAALPNVRSTDVVEVAGDALRLRVTVGGDADALRQAARDGGRLTPDPPGAADAAVEFTLRP